MPDSASAVGHTGKNMSPNVCQDGLLMEALAMGRDSALNEIMARWEGPLMRFVYRFTQNESLSHDLVQETFVRLYLNREKYRFGSNFSSWVFTIAANLCRNQHRWRKRHPSLPIEEGLTEAQHFSSAFPGYSDAHETDNPDDQLIRKELCEAVRAAIAKLSPDLRTTLILFEYEGLSYEEISEIVGCSRKGVETRLYRARKRIKKSLESFLALAEII